MTVLVLLYHYIMPSTVGTKKRNHTNVSPNIRQNPHNYNLMLKCDFDISECSGRSGSRVRSILRRMNYQLKVKKQANPSQL